VSDSGRDEISRRKFLISAAGVAGGAATGLVWGATPCPPPTLAVSGGTSVTTACSTAAGQLPSLTLTSAAASGTYGWSVGHAFRQGDLPSGSYVSAGGAALQTDVRNSWPDGSVKFAVLSGVTAFSSGVAKVLALAGTTTAPSGAPVAEPTSLNVAVTFSGAVTGTYTLQSCLGIDRSTWNKSGGGRVRRILGPVMSEFHYYCPTSDAHVTVWFYVRQYSNGTTEVETVVENGWFNVAAPGERDYSVTVSVGGATTYSGSVTHYSHARWSRVDWVGPNPQITPHHDPAYMRASKVVPNYAFLSPTATAFSGISATSINPAPLALGDWNAAMGDTGDVRPIGLLPHWECLYCISADPRAYVATIGNNRGSGRWPIHYRDETTGRVPLYTSYPNTTLTSGWGTQPPTPSGGSVGNWDIPHHPSNGYLAYLIEGRWTQLESLQFSAFQAIIESNPVTRRGGGVLSCDNAPLTTRGTAWAWRTMGQAAAISPETLSGAAPPASDLAVGDAYRKSIDDTASYNRQQYVDGSINGGAFKNTIGWLGQYDRYSDGTPDIWWGGGWMVQFQIAALAHISDLGIAKINQGNLTAVRDHAYDGIVRMCGTDSTWNYRHAVTYDMPYLKSSSGTSNPVFMTTPEAYANYTAIFSLTALSANRGDTLKDHSSNNDMNPGGTSNDADGYWAPVIANLSTAMEHGKAGAAAAFALVSGASNYDPVGHGINDKPKWGIRSR
jgi:hypothetical protein